MTNRSDIPRASFRNEHTLKTTFDFNYLIPFYCKEVLPADSIRGRVQVFARLGSSLIFPLMDRAYLDTFFFFVPNRIVWSNWKKMMGERANPSDSISYTIPTINSNNAAAGFGVCSIFDYFGLPTPGTGVTGTDSVNINALPLRGYNKIFNEWFRDQNLQNSVVEATGDIDGSTNYVLLRRNKRHDYFTSALPTPQKGSDVAFLAGTAPVKGLAVNAAIAPVTGGFTNAIEKDGTSSTGYPGYFMANNVNQLVIRASGTTAGLVPNIYADLSGTGGTINALRTALATQVLLERDMRGGTRYVEQLQMHFGVSPEDVRLQRPEYIGGGTTAIQTQAIPQTAVDRKSSDNTINNPLGSLGATALANDNHSFSYHATEHGFIIGLCNAYGEVTYQQGMHRMWTRSTRLDHYYPAFANLGEQAIRMDEIFVRGNANDTAVFGYQERWAEYKYEQSRITGYFKSTTANNIDEWHLAEQFSAAPSLNSAFIQQSTPITRALSSAQANMNVLLDAFFEVEATRPMPMFNTPAQLGRF